MTRRETRIYPARCTSAFCGCGRATCPETCPGLPALREFGSWRDRTGAKVADPIWSPLVFIAEVEVRS